MGRSPWTAADALVGLLGLEEADFNWRGGGSWGTRADQGVCPTIASGSSALGKLSDIGTPSCPTLPENLAEEGHHGGERLVGGLRIVAWAFVAHEGVLGGIKLDGIIDAGFA